MSNIIFRTGDLIQDKNDKWYGVVLEDGEMRPNVYPIYARKYKIKWCKGAIAWHWGADIKLISRAKK